VSEKFSVGDRVVVFDRAGTIIGEKPAFGLAIPVKTIYRVLYDEGWEADVTDNVVQRTGAGS
jgi:hypothetical protein